MSGAMTLVRFMQGKLSLPETGKMGDDTIAKLNSYTKTKTAETSLFKAIWQRRLEYLQSLKSFATYGKGWTNRMNDLLKRGLSYIDTNKGKIGFGALLLVAGSLYYAYSKNLIRL
jgi:lysozyme family protein